MIVLDASVLIAQLSEEDALHTCALQRMNDVAEHAFAASPVTLGEVLVGPARADRLEVGRRSLERLSIQAVPLLAQSAPRLAVLRADTGLKIPDCCVLLAAQDTRADAVLTLDERLAKAAGRLGIGVV